MLKNSPIDADNPTMEPTVPWRVLVVDDDEQFRHLLDRVLAADPRFTVVATASSAGTAIAMVAAQQPDVVVLDHGLPDAWGAHSVRGLKRVGRDMSVVIFSAAPECLDARDLDVDEWIDKSRVCELPDLLTSVLARRAA